MMIFSYLADINYVTTESVQVPKEVNRDKVLSEALIMYTLLETANTMKLINVTPVDVAKQCDFLQNEYA